MPCSMEIPEYDSERDLGDIELTRVTVPHQKGLFDILETPGIYQ